MDFRVAQSDPKSAPKVRLDWTGLDWTGLDWTGLDWTGLDWTGLDWTGLDWSGLDWTGVDWTGTGQNRTGLDWTGLDWIELHCTGLDWAGLGWSGLDQHCMRWCCNWDWMGQESLEWTGEHGGDDGNWLVHWGWAALDPESPMAVASSEPPKTPTPYAADARHQRRPERAPGCGARGQGEDGGRDSAPRAAVRPLPCVSARITAQGAPTAARAAVLPPFAVGACLPASDIPLPQHGQRRGCRGVALRWIVGNRNWASPVPSPHASAAGPAAPYLLLPTCSQPAGAAAPTDPATATALPLPLRCRCSGVAAAAAGQTHAWARMPRRRRRVRRPYPSAGLP
eukprot:gene18501-biopygen42759